MQDIPRHEDELARADGHRLIFEIDDQASFQREKHFVRVGMAMPVEVASHYADAYHMIVHVRKDPIFPVVRNGRRLTLQVDLGNVSHWQTLVSFEDATVPSLGRQQKRNSLTHV